MNATGATSATDAMNTTDAKYFLITIDVEDWFQVENFKPWIPFATWDTRELRVEQNVHRLLDLFDSIDLPSETSGLKNVKLSRKPRATFFVLSWIAERLPHIVREIAARGHEVASHGCYHELPKKMSLPAIRSELKNSQKRLEDTIGKAVVGFRAPSFAIDNFILETIATSGYLYDSSYNSFSFHGRYGKISLNGQAHVGIAHRIFNNFCELPISNFNLLGNVLPLGGGAYFRLIPFRVFRLGVKCILKKENAFLFYIHPWEIDPGQPRMSSVSWKCKIRHYSMLSKTYGRLGSMINAFNQCRFTTCEQYLSEQNACLVSSG